MHETFFFFLAPPRVVVDKAPRQRKLNSVHSARSGHIFTESGVGKVDFAKMSCQTEVPGVKAALQRLEELG